VGASRWTALVQSAQVAVDRCRAALRAVRAEQSALAGSRGRVQAMIADYQARLALARRGGHTMREDEDARRFLAQLDTLRSRVLQEETHSTHRVEQALLALAQAEARLGKFQHLEQSELAAMTATKARLEQKLTDEWAVIAHSWRER
jgi:flagellar biosynthesis chaperone FliJ